MQVHTRGRVAALCCLGEGKIAAVGRSGCRSAAVACFECSGRPATNMLILAGPPTKAESVFVSQDNEVSLERLDPMSLSAAGLEARKSRSGSRLRNRVTKHVRRPDDSARALRSRCFPLGELGREDALAWKMAQVAVGPSWAPPWCPGAELFNLLGRGDDDGRGGIWESLRKSAPFPGSITPSSLPAELCVSLLIRLSLSR